MPITLNKNAFRLPERAIEDLTSEQITYLYGIPHTRLAYEYPNDPEHYTWQMHRLCEHMSGFVSDTNLRLTPSEAARNLALTSKLNRILREHQNILKKFESNLFYLENPNGSYGIKKEMPLFFAELKFALEIIILHLHAAVDKIEKTGDDLDVKLSALNQIIEIFDILPVCAEGAHEKLTSMKDQIKGTSGVKTFVAQQLNGVFTSIGSMHFNAARERVLRESATDDTALRLLRGNQTHFPAFFKMLAYDLKFIAQDQPRAVDVIVPKFTIVDGYVIVEPKNNACLLDEEYVPVVGQENMVRDFKEIFAREFNVQTVVQNLRDHLLENIDLINQKYLKSADSNRTDTMALDRQVFMTEFGLPTEGGFFEYFDDAYEMKIKDRHECRYWANIFALKSLESATYLDGIDRQALGEYFLVTDGSVQWLEGQNRQLINLDDVTEDELKVILNLIDDKVSTFGLAHVMCETLKRAELEQEVDTYSALRNPLIDSENIANIDQHPPHFIFNSIHDLKRLVDYCENQGNLPELFASLEESPRNALQTLFYEALIDEEQNEDARGIIDLILATTISLPTGSNIKMSDPKIYFPEQLKEDIFLVDKNWGQILPDAWLDRYRHNVAREKFMWEWKSIDFPSHAKNFARAIKESVRFTPYVLTRLLVNVSSNENVEVKQAVLTHFFQNFQSIQDAGIRKKILEKSLPDLLTVINAPSVLDKVTIPSVCAQQLFQALRVHHKDEFTDEAIVRICMMPANLHLFNEYVHLEAPDDLRAVLKQKDLLSDAVLSPDLLRKIKEFVKTFFLSDDPANIKEAHEIIEIIHSKNKNGATLYSEDVVNHIMDDMQEPDKLKRLMKIPPAWRDKAATAQRLDCLTGYPDVLAYFGERPTPDQVVKNRLNAIYAHQVPETALASVFGMYSDFFRTAPGGARCDPVPDYEAILYDLVRTPERLALAIVNNNSLSFMQPVISRVISKMLTEMYDYLLKADPPTIEMLLLFEDFLRVTNGLHQFLLFEDCHKIFSKLPANIKQNSALIQYPPRRPEIFLDAVKKFTVDDLLTLYTAQKNNMGKSLILSLLLHAHRSQEAVSIILRQTTGEIAQIIFQYLKPVGLSFLYEVISTEKGMDAFDMWLESTSADHLYKKFPRNYFPSPGLHDLNLKNPNDRARIRGWVLAKPPKDKVLSPSIKKFHDCSIYTYSDTRRGLLVQFFLDNNGFSTDRLASFMNCADDDFIEKYIGNSTEGEIRIIFTSQIGRYIFLERFKRLHPIDLTPQQESRIFSVLKNCAHDKVVLSERSWGGYGPYPPINFMSKSFMNQLEDYSSHVPEQTRLYNDLQWCARLSVASFSNIDNIPTMNDCLRRLQGGDPESYCHLIKEYDARAASNPSPGNLRPFSEMLVEYYSAEEPALSHFISFVLDNYISGHLVITDDLQMLYYQSVLRRNKASARQRPSANVDLKSIFSECGFNAESSFYYSRASADVAVKFIVNFVTKDNFKDILTDVHVVLWPKLLSALNILPADQANISFNWLADDEVLPSRLTSICTFYYSHRSRSERFLQAVQRSSPPDLIQDIRYYSENGLVLGTDVIKNELIERFVEIYQAQSSVEDEVVQAIIHADKRR